MKRKNLNLLITSILLICLAQSTQAQFAAQFNLDTLNGNNGFVINAVDSHDVSGFSLSGIGDINGDGVDDVIIGAPFADFMLNLAGGESYVVFGKSTGFSASFDLSSLDGGNGFLINGINNEDNLGYSVSGLGDVNDDGIDDFIIGARWADSNGNSGGGKSYVVFGKNAGFSANFDLPSLDGNNGFVINGIDIDDNSGSSVSGVGDMNGDNINDIIIGAPFADVNGSSNVGESYVVFGNNAGFPANFDLSSLDGSNGFVMYGIDSLDFSGRSLSKAGDINGDGLFDVVIGVSSADPAGESYVVFGANNFLDSLNLSDLDGNNGFVIHGIDAGDFSGRSVSGAGDVNGDGVDDLLIGANTKPLSIYK